MEEEVKSRPPEHLPNCPPEWKKDIGSVLFTEEEIQTRFFVFHMFSRVQQNLDLRLCANQGAWGP